MKPLISIVIPVGGSHAKYVGTALASCVWQTVKSWEAIVVNDGIADLGPYDDKRIKVIDSPNRYIERGKQNGNRAAMARNAGVKKASGDYVVFLDADDYLLPSGLEILCRGHLYHDQTYTYSSHYSSLGQHMRPAEYDQNIYRTFNLHPITCLIPTDAVRSVSGFDESAPGWEDWTLYLRLAIAGYCGSYVRGPVFVYRDNISMNHHEDVAGGQQLMDRVIQPYKDLKGNIKMAACCGGSNRDGMKKVVADLGVAAATDDGLVTLEYTGNMQGSFILRIPGTTRSYRTGLSSAVKYIRVIPEDVEYLMSVNKFRRVVPTPEFTAAPEPMTLVEIPAAPMIDSGYVMVSESVVEEVATPTPEPVVTTPKLRGRAKKA